MALLISKINEIKVIQVGESKLSVENKSKSGSKVGTKKEKLAKGVIKTISLGQSERKYSIKLYSRSRQENDDLTDILTNKKYITITDKYKGKINVFANLIDIVDNDKHINQTIFNISCTVQDAELKKSVNFSVKIDSAIKKTEAEIDELSKTLSDIVDTFETFINPVTGGINFVDSALDLVRDGVLKILDVKKTVLDAYLASIAKVDRAKRLLETIKGLKDFPDAFTDMLDGVTSNDPVDTSRQNQNSVTGQSTVFQETGKSEITPPVQPTVGNVPASEVDPDDLSQFALTILEKELIASSLVNKVKLVRDLKLVLDGGFNSQDDFEQTIDALVERLNFVGYDETEISEKVYIIKAFANEQEYREIIEIEIDRPRPLIAIVYGLYGSLDNYESIESINSLVENDYITGTLKVFAA